MTRKRTLAALFFSLCGLAGCAGGQQGVKLSEPVGAAPGPENKRELVFKGQEDVCNFEFNRKTPVVVRDSNGAFIVTGQCPPRDPKGVADESALSPRQRAVGGALQRVLDFLP